MEFGEIGPDQSYGRVEDGSESLGLLPSASPGTSNSTASFLGYEVIQIGDQEWVDTGDWIGWLEVGDNPWIWSTLWNNWIYLSESLSDSTGTWICIVNPDTTGAVDGDGTYMGYTIQDIDGSQWIDAGDWIGWLEVSQAPWVWSVTAASWIYVYENGSSNSSIWFRLLPY